MRKVILALVISTLIIFPLSSVFAYGTDYRYTGKPYDPAADLYDYGARNYQPDIGRFIQPDPLQNVLTNPEKLKQMTGKDLNQILMNPQALNPYSYTQNNPVRYIDPEGEFNFETNQVEKGDTLKGVFGNNWQEVANYNNLENPNLIYPGQHLNLPVFIQKKFWEKVIDTIYTYVPGFSDVRDFYEAFTKKDFVEGRALTPGEETLTVTGALLVGAISGNELRNLNRAGKALDSLKGVTFTSHGIDQIIDRGVKPSDIKDALKTPLNIVKRIDDLGRTSFRYLGKNAMVVINKAQGVITSWHLHK